MPTHRYSFWDHQAHRRDASLPTLLDALTARTGAFAELQAQDDTARRQAAFEYQRRVEYWTEQGQIAKHWTISTVGLLVPLMAAAVGLAFKAGTEIILAMALASVAIALTIIGWRSHQQFWTLKLTLTRRQCPDCRYDLTRSRSAIDPVLLNDTCVGPQTCPECGAPWPLLPATLPAK